MPEFDPDDLIGKTILPPPQENGESLRAKVITGFYQQVKSFWSCSHMNYCLQTILHINLHIVLLRKTTQFEIFKNHENPSST